MKSDINKVIKEGCNSNEPNESSFKQKIVLDLIQKLGWEKNDVEIEKQILMGTTTHYIDYILKLNQKFVLVIEVKSPTIEIENNKKFYGEIISYLKQTNIKYGLLYNGNKLLLFNKKGEILLKWNCDKLNIEIFELFKKENFPIKLNEFLSENQKRKKLKKLLEKRKEDINKKLIKIIKKLSNNELNENFIKNNIKFELNLLNNKNNLYKKEKNSKELKNENFLYLSQKDAEQIVIKILYELNKPLKRKEIVEEVGKRVQLTDYDKEILKSGTKRWNSTVRWAVTTLKNKGLIKTEKGNDWILTEKGKEIYINKFKK